MFRSLLLLVLLAGVAGYFTKPTEAQHRDAVNSALHQMQESAASNLDIGAVLESSVARVTQEGTFEDLYVATKYTVKAGERPLVECWGAFGQVRCMPAVSGGDAAAKGG